jgi:hypothetical protein
MTSTNPADYISPIEQLGRIVFRPCVRLKHGGLRATETVSIIYSGTSGALNATASGQSRYVRVWVYNSFGFPAHRCQVFVDRILFAGEPIESERSPLHWTDFGDDTFEYPQVMRHGDKNGWYVDLCSADSVVPALQIQSLKGIKRGYHKFDKAGIYGIELSAEAAKPCSFGHLTVAVLYDGKDWQNLEIISAQ